MAKVGQTFVDLLTVTGGDGTTAVTVQRISPARATTTVTGAATSDGGTSWLVLVPAPDVPGRWWVKWTVTGAGAGVFWNPVDVAPSGYTATAPHAYATTTDLANYLYGTTGTAQPLPEDAEGRLARASARLDRVLKASIYPVYEDGATTETEHIAAMRDAVCEWVAWWEDTGDESGAFSSAGGGLSVSAGQITLSRSGAAGGGGAVQNGLYGPGWIPAQAVVYLENAGLLGHAPYVC